jgi:hypothetical protein
MPDNHHAGHAMIQHLREVRERLTGLIPKLHEAGERCVLSAKPLATLDELDLAKRRELAKTIFAACQEWEEVTLLIERTVTSLEAVAKDGPDRQSVG